MEILSVYDSEFHAYGRIIPGYDTAALMEEMEKIPLPDEGTAYRAGIEELEACAIYPQLSDRFYGGLPIQAGMCWGRNTRLNCLEYHRDSELNLGTGDFILLLAKQQEMENGKLETSRVKAFRVPRGVLVEVYATTLHFAPCHTDRESGFRVAVILPKGTNTQKPDIQPLNWEDRLLWARNKWLIAHEEAKQARLGAFVGLVGENIDISDYI